MKIDNYLRQEKIYINIRKHYKIIIFIIVVGNVRYDYC